MPSTVLALASDAADELGMQRPITLFGADEGDNYGRKALRAVTRTCRYLIATWDWQICRRTHEWQTAATEAQPLGKPTDFERYVPDTFWHSGLRREVHGPKTPGEWERYTSGIQVAADPIWYEEGGVIYVKPQPRLNEVLRYRYISNSVGLTAAGARIARFGDDADVPLWDDELLLLGTVFHYRQSERTADETDRVSFMTLMHDRIKRDGGSRTINMGGKSRTADAMLQEVRNAARVIQIGGS